MLMRITIGHCCGSWPTLLLTDECPSLHLALVLHFLVLSHPTLVTPYLVTALIGAYLLPNSCCSFYSLTALVLSQAHYTIPRLPLIPRCTHCHYCYMFWCVSVYPSNIYHPMLSPCVKYIVKFKDLTPINTTHACACTPSELGCILQQLGVNIVK